MRRIWVSKSKPFSVAEVDVDQGGVEVIFLENGQGGLAGGGGLGVMPLILDEITRRIPECLVVVYD